MTDKSTIQAAVRLVALFICSHLAHGQFRNDSALYAQTMKEGIETLTEEIKSHPDANLFFYPERALIGADSYVFSYPLSADYRIGLLIDPCRYNSYNCCMNVFGTPEYPALLKSNLEAERVNKYIVLASETEVASNYYLVYEDGGSIAASAKRGADDEKIHNTSCISAGNPYSFCQGRNFATSRSALRPACMDNNSTLDVQAGCYDIYGNYSKHCVQVGYTSNAFIPQCLDNEDDHCGTFLEIHMAHGTPYSAETDIIAQQRITQRNVSGYYTTTLPLTWMGNSSKILCTYTESNLRINSLVYIKSSAPICCCPQPYQASTRIGSFQCPIGAAGINGAFAKRSQTRADTLSVDSLMLAYPYCHTDLSSNTDRCMMCSAYDQRNRRHFTRECKNITYDSDYATLENTKRAWTSIDMLSRYDGACPYYSSCAITLDSGKCRLTDLRFTFVGSVGLVTKLDNTVDIPQVWVTFNNGRTSYQFDQQDVVMETTQKSMYEIWWVIRSKSEFTVQKRKGFNVSSPDCTFDTTNNRYFPYAKLKDGVPEVTSGVP